MTYGHWLDQASDAVRAAEQAAAHDRADGHGDAAAAINARARIYRQLVRLVDHIGGPVAEPTSTAAADRLVNSSRRLAATNTATLLGVGLRAATSYARDLPPAASLEPGDVTRHLASAAEALGVAADILASHLGVPGQQRPSTPHGQALVAGAGQRGALADIAHLATEVFDVDRRLVGWLSHGRPVRTLRPVYAPVTDHLRWWTRGPYPTLLRGVAAQRNGESVLRLLDVAPATERSTGPRQITSLRDVVGVLDTALAWFQQHPRHAQMSYTRAVTRLAVTITAGAVVVDPEAVGRTDVGAYAHRWDQVAKKLQNLAGLDCTQRDHLVREVIAASDWLRNQVHVEAVAHKQTGVAPSKEWQSGLAAMLGRLPALARQLNHAVAVAVGQGQVLVPQHQLDMTAPKRGIFHAKARWHKAAPDDNHVRAVRYHLAVAVRTPADHSLTLPTAPGAAPALARQAYQNPPKPASAVPVSPKHLELEPRPACRTDGETRASGPRRR